jgi:DNA-binding response OmpR family regulator
VKRILSIDDEPSMLRCLKQALESQGYELLITDNPEKGLETLKTDMRICLALLDIRMPGKNGFEIYKELREFRKIPVLFVTAYPKSFTTHSDEVVKMWKNEFADGTTDIIYKPFDLDMLFEKVEGLVGSAADEDRDEPDD